MLWKRTSQSDSTHLNRCWSGDQSSSQGLRGEGKICLAETREGAMALSKYWMERKPILIQTCEETNALAGNFEERLYLRSSSEHSELDHHFFLHAEKSLSIIASVPSHRSYAVVTVIRNGMTCLFSKVPLN